MSHRILLYQAIDLISGKTKHIYQSILVFKGLKEHLQSCHVCRIIGIGPNLPLIPFGTTYRTGKSLHTMNDLLGCPVVPEVNIVISEADCCKALTTSSIDENFVSGVSL